MVELLSAYDVWDHDRFEWRDGKTSHCVYLSSGELYPITGETPECRDLSEFY